SQSLRGSCDPAHQTPQFNALNRHFDDDRIHVRGPLRKEHIPLITPIVLEESPIMDDGRGSDQRDVSLLRVIQIAERNSSGTCDFRSLARTAAGQEADHPAVLIHLGEKRLHHARIGAAMLIGGHRPAVGYVCGDIRGRDEDLLNCTAFNMHRGCLPNIRGLHLEYIFYYSHAMAKDQQSGEKASRFRSYDIEKV